MSCHKASEHTIAIWKALLARNPNTIAQMIACMRESMRDNEGSTCSTMTDSEIEDYLVQWAAKKLAS